MGVCVFVRVCGEGGCMSTHGAGVGVGSASGTQLKVQGKEVLPMIVDLEALILVPQPNGGQVQYGNSEEDIYAEKVSALQLLLYYTRGTG